MQKWNVDDAAHCVVKFKPAKVYELGDYSSFYHENRLYSVRNKRTEMVMLVHADSSKDAILKVSNEIALLQSGNYIQYVNR